MDTAINTTWYASLSDKAKLAIVDKTFTQDQWYINESTGSPAYYGYYGDAPNTTYYWVSRCTTTYGNSITRHVYTPSIQDIMDYILDTSIGDGQLSSYNIYKMLWNMTEKPYLSGRTDSLWLSSARAAYTSAALSNGECTLITVYGGQFSWLGHQYKTQWRPMLQLDLSKIKYRIVS